MPNLTSRALACMILANLRFAVDNKLDATIAGDTFNHEEIRQALRHLIIEDEAK